MHFCIAVSFSGLKQYYVLFNCFLDPLRLDSNVSLCDRRTAVPQQLLHQDNVKARPVINFSCVPLPEAVHPDFSVA